MAVGDGRLWAIIPEDEVRLWQDGGRWMPSGLYRTFLRRDGALESAHAFANFSPFFPGILCRLRIVGAGKAGFFVPRQCLMCLQQGRINHHP